MLQILQLITVFACVANSFADFNVSINDEPTTDTSTSSVITAWVEGTHKDTGKSVQIFFGNESDSEIVLRELKDVSVHCEAEFPVQLDFKSYVGFKLLATGSGSSSKSYANATHQSTVQKHTTYAHLVSLKEIFTGYYTCLGRSSQTKGITISAFIYVPSDKLFVSTKTAAISAKGQDSIVIPCPISDPNATVRLVKLHENDTIKPVLTAQYNPRIGFNLLLNSEHSSEPEETYYCIAKTKKVHRAVEFTVVNGLVTCSQRCSENSKCQLVNDQEVCECKPTYTEAFVSGKCLIECSRDADCPTNLACLPQDSGSFLLDILSSVEGRTAAAGDEEKEENEQGMNRGECKNPCIYRTTTCSLEASQAVNEECQVVEHKAVCQIPKL